MIDHTVGSILSREGVQQGDVIATFLFTLIYGPVLHNIFTRMHAICSSIQLFAILDDITFTAPTTLASRMFAICTEELASINISTVPNKTHLLINASDRCNLPSDLHSEIQVHTDGIRLLGTAIGDDEFLHTFLDQKLRKVQVLLSKVSKLQSLNSKYQILKLSINSKLRHLLRSLPPSRPPVQAFHSQFDEVIQTFFSNSFHIQDSPAEFSLQSKLSTINGGMGLLALSDLAPSAFLASLRNMLSEFIIRNPNTPNPTSLLRNWSYENEAVWAWEKYHSLIDQMNNQGTLTAWSHDSFLALPQHHTQQKLHQLYGQAQLTNLISMVEPRRAIKILSAAGTGASSFLSSACSIPGYALSNTELEIAVKLRLGCKVHPHIPQACICGNEIDTQGDHLLKCKRGNEWDTRHTALKQCMAAIIRSAYLPVSHEVTIASLAPPRPGFSPPQGRMDLVVTDSDFSTLLADVTITHPNPSINQPVTQSMLQRGHFSSHRENTKRTKYGEAASSIGAKFIPLVLETFGSVGKSFHALLHSLSLELFRRSPNSDTELEIKMKAKLINLWRTRISLTLQKANARLLLSKISRTHQSTQRSSPTTMVDFSTISSW